MRMPFTAATVLLLSSLASSQTRTGDPKPPKEVLRQFVKMELDGARLTPEGRSETARFVALPTDALPYPINIVSDKLEIGETPSPKNNPKLNVYFPYLYGQLDSTLRFTAALHMRPGNSLIREGTNTEYTLTLANKEPQVDPPAPTAKEATRPPEWKIENVPSYGFISLATAIRYVTEQREKATDPTVKKNADETLTKLKRLAATLPSAAH